MLIDSHAHIFTEQFKRDINTILENAAAANVGKICMPNIDEKSINPMLKLSETYPDICHPMMGLHPSSVTADYNEQLTRIKAYLDNGTDYLAVGEIGIDLYWDKSLKQEQIEAFKIQVEWAAEKELPIVIHCRDSMDLVIEILEEMAIQDLTGVFHCFTGNIEQAERIFNLGFYIGLGGILTFKNSGLDKVVESIDLSRIILETDSPYLSPTPHRGRRNEPAYVKYVAEKLSEIKGESVEKVAEITTENVMNLYNWV